VRQLLTIALLAFAPLATAQPSFGIGIGAGAGAAGCQAVARQILRDWPDVSAVMAPDGGLRRPSAQEFRCVAPAQLQYATPRRAGTSELRCFKVSGAGACCDADMQACAML
jgi:hypothetical protein